MMSEQEEQKLLMGVIKYSIQWGAICFGLGLVIGSGLTFWFFTTILHWHQ